MDSLEKSEKDIEKKQMIDEKIKKMVEFFENYNGKNDKSPGMYFRSTVNGGKPFAIRINGFVEVYSFEYYANIQFVCDNEYADYELQEGENPKLDVVEGYQITSFEIEKINLIEVGYAECIGDSETNHMVVKDKLEL